MWASTETKDRLLAPSMELACKHMRVDIILSSSFARVARTHTRLHMLMIYKRGANIYPNPLQLLAQATEADV